MHSNISDGTATVAEIVDIVIAIGLDIFALTDHDTINGCIKIRNDFVGILKENNIRFINGIEFSTNDDGQEAHILAYNFDINNSIINDLIKENGIYRILRVTKAIKSLKEKFGIELTADEIEYVFSMDNPSRPRIANILIQKGYGTDVGQVLKKYLSDVSPKDKLDMCTTVKKIKKAGAVCVLAHPLDGANHNKITYEECEKRVGILKECGLDGIECFYYDYEESQRIFLKSIAQKYDLLLSGGSDYHGKNRAVSIGTLSRDNYVPDESDLTILKLLKK